MAKQYYQDLLVWQKAMELVTLIYQETRNFPREEMYGLTGQMRRAAVSVPSNIAEGQGRLTRGEFRQFLGQAKGSLMELETQLLIARNLTLIKQESVNHLIRITSDVGRMLNALIVSLTPDERD